MSKPEISWHPGGGLLGPGWHYRWLRGRYQSGGGNYDTPGDAAVAAYEARNDWLESCPICGNARWAKDRRA